MSSTGTAVKFAGTVPSHCACGCGVTILDRFVHGSVKGARSFGCYVPACYSRKGGWSGAWRSQLHVLRADGGFYEAEV